MIKKNIEAFLVTHDDEHLLENTPKNHERLKWISGFTGSAGYLIITIKNLFLFVDGRYSIQSKVETKGLNINIFDVSNTDFIKFISLNKNQIKNIAFDPRTISKAMYDKYYNITKASSLRVINLKVNLIDLLWIRNLSTQQKDKIFLLEDKYSGKSYKEKVSLIYEYIKNKNANSIFIQNSESVAWLFNIRGADLPYTPITFAYTLISKDFIYIFLEDSNLKKEIKKIFPSKVKFYSFTEIPKLLTNLKAKRLKTLIDPKSTSIFYYNIVKKNSKCVFSADDPITKYKAIKNKTEVSNLCKAHIIDGVALTKFIFWLKNLKQKITELDVVEKIDSLRSKNKTYICKSFPTIAGSGSNGAIIHYIPSKHSNRKLKTNDILLLDSGGQYKYGTTDVTRTISIGSPSASQKENYTLVLKGHIKLSKAIFPKGTNGGFLDYLARHELWKNGKDYAHGTGHGVGYCLNVHEGPFSISKNNKIELENRMVFSNEPGYYLEKQYGIRIENLVTTKKMTMNRKDFFKIETLTLAPYDMSLINKKLLTEEEKSWINFYHKEIYKKLSPKLSYKEKNWLIKETKKI